MNDEASAIILDVPAYTIRDTSPRIAKYRCSKGHEWEEEKGPWIGTTVSGWSLDGKTLCQKCLTELIAANVGFVEEVK